jgi:catechol 2,3-dioxygenase-like lactoylglutathione lyase family enzyme
VFAMSKMFASYSVDDINAARQFYGELGLKVTPASDERGPLWLHFAGDQEVLLYPKADHVPATYTVLNLSVTDVEEAVDELAARGVQTIRFEGYEADDRGIHRSRGRSIAWFADPAGNFLSVFQQD